MKSSVLVVGAGISGMRVAAELLRQGFGVYLLDQRPTIGGSVAREEKLSPTDEHTACALRPLLDDLEAHPGLTLLTRCELRDARGDPGDLHVQVHRKPCYVDWDRCTACTDCFAVCPVSGTPTAFGAVMQPPRAIHFDSPYPPYKAVIDPAICAYLVDGECGDGDRTPCAEACGPDAIDFLQRVEPLELHVGAVIIATGSREPKAEALARRRTADLLGVELDEAGFFRPASDDHPVRTAREGVFVCGSAHGPMGIGERIVEACAAASQAAAFLASAKPEAPDVRPEMKALPPVEGADEPRIAVIVSRSGASVDSVLDLEEIAEFARGLPHVEHVELTPFADDGRAITEVLGAGGFNRLVVAGYTPITHEPRFRRLAEDAGLNPYLVEVVNLREQCAWVHRDEGAEATQKAKVLVRMGVARASLLEPLDALRFRIEQSALVVGGTPGGMACASALARIGFRVHLIESGSDLEKPGEEAQPFARNLESTLRGQADVVIHTDARVAGVNGSVGRFLVDLEGQGGSQQVEAGTIVVATEKPMGASSAEDGYEAQLALSRDEQGRFAPTQGLFNLLDAVTEGVFLCGAARAPMSPEKALVEGEAAASRAAGVIAWPEMTKPPTISRVNNERCDGCAYCIDPCPTRSLKLLEFAHKGEIKKIAELNERTCIGCGICMSTCPKGGIDVRHFELEELQVMVEAAIEESAALGTQEPMIVCFCCNRCAYPAADAAGRAGIQYPAGVRIIRQVCAGMVHPKVVTDALTQGADGVLLCGCHVGECRSREGIKMAMTRADAIWLMLEDFALEEERFRLEHIAASEGAKFARVVTEMSKELIELGPNPFK